MRYIARSDNLNDNTAHNKRDLVTSDEPDSSIEIAGPAAAGDPAADGAAGVRARRVAVELPPRRARPRAQPVGDQPSDPRAGTAVRREAVRPRRALGAVDRGWRALSRQGLGGAGDAAGSRPRDAAASPRQWRRALDQRAAVFHQHGADPGAGGFQAAPSRNHAAHRSDPSIRRLQQLAGRRRHSVRTRAFDRPEIRTAGRGYGVAGLRARADQERPAQAKGFIPSGADPPHLAAARLA